MPRPESGAPGERAPAAAPPPWARRMVAWIVRNDRAILLFALVLTVAASASLLRLRLDVDLVSMLPTGYDRFADYQRYVRRFGPQDVAVAVIRARDAATAIRFADPYASALRADPEIVDVRSRIDLPAFARALSQGALPRLLPADALPAVEKRLSPEGVADAVRTVRRVLSAPGTVGVSEVIAGDPLGLTRILGDALARSRPDRALAAGSEYVLSPDGTRLLVLIRPVASGYDGEGITRLEDALARAEASARAASGIDGEVEVVYTGAFAYAREDSTVLREDMGLYSVVAFLGVVTLFHLGFRTLRVLPLVAAQLVATSIVTFALGLLFYGVLNAVSLAFAAIFYGLSIDAAIYFYTRFREELALRGDLEEAIAASIAGLLVPAVVASGTTAAVFVVIGFSALAGVAQLGYLTALGILLNIPATYVLLPAMLLWRGAGARHGDRALAATHRLAALPAFAEDHRRLVAVGAAALCAIAWLAARGEALDTNLFHLRPARSHAAAVQGEIERTFGVSDPDGVVLAEAEVAPTRDAAGAAAADETVLRATERVRDALERARAEGLVTDIVSPAPLMPSRATQESRLAAWAALPRERAAAELERRLDERGFRTEPFAPALASLRRVPEPVDATADPLPGLEILFDRHVRRDATGVGIITPFAPTSPQALEQIADRLPRDVDAGDGVRITVTGRPLMERELDRTMRREIVWFLLLAIASNAPIVWMQERRWSSTLAILSVPSGCVLLLVALARLAGIALNPVNLIILPLTIGMGVDYCVYLVQRVRETGGYRSATASSGRALALTAAATVLGFGVLGFSRYPALSELGQLGALAMALSFSAAMAVLPALLPSAAARRGAAVAGSPGGGRTEAPAGALS